MRVIMRDWRKNSMLLNFLIAEYVAPLAVGAAIVAVVAVLIALSCRKRSYTFSYRSHTITVAVKAHTMVLLIDGKFGDEFGGSNVWSATLKATVENAEIKARVRRRGFSFDVEVYADGELLPLLGVGK